MSSFDKESWSSFDEYEDSDEKEYWENQDELYEYELHQAYTALGEITERLLFMDEGERNLDGRDYSDDECYYDGIYKNPEWWSSYYESIEHIDDAQLEEEYKSGVLLNPILVSTLYGWDNLVDGINPKSNVIYLSDRIRYKAEMAKFVEELFRDATSGDIEKQIDSSISNGFWCIKIYFEGKYLYYWARQEEVVEISESYEEILKKFEKAESVFELIPEEFLDMKDAINKE